MGFPFTALLLAWLAAACAMQPGPSPSAAGQTPSGAAPSPTINVPIGTVDPATSGVVEAVIADAASRMEREPGEFEVLLAEAGIWSDSSLGCPLPGVSYLQSLTDGYWVVVRVDSFEVDYRVAADGGELTICTLPPAMRQGPIE